MAADESGKACTVVLHDDRLTKVDILAGNRIMHVGEFAYLTAPGARKLTIAPAGLASNTGEISIHVRLAKRFGFENRTQGSVQLIEEIDKATATHVELFFRDQYLSRADMWQLMGRIQETIIYQGQVLDFLGSETAEVKQIYIAGKEVESAMSIHPYTKPIFRSGSARYTILIEVSKEMLENWIDGEIMYERLVDGFLPDLFCRWDSLKVRHQVSIILFGRVKTPKLGTGQLGAAGHPIEDFFHILASEMSSTLWPQMLRKLKRAFNRFDLPRAVSQAAESNILEAIHLTAMDFADDQTDAHLMSFGTSIIAVTAAAGLFEADHHLLKETTDLLVGNSIGVDVVALSPKPLHPVPLFRYEHAGTTEFALPHWVDISFWSRSQERAVSTWSLRDPGGPVNGISLPLLQESGWSEIDESVMDLHDRSVFEADASAKSDLLRPISKAPHTDAVRSVDTMKCIPTLDESLKKQKIEHEVPKEAADGKASGSSDVPLSDSTNPPKRPRMAPHPLMQTGRKISVGPKGLAPSRSVASTTLSSTHAQQERELFSGSPLASGTMSSGIAKAIRASLARKPSQQSLASNRISNISDPDHSYSYASRPIDIRTVHESSTSDSSNPASELEQKIADTTMDRILVDTSLSATPKAGLQLRRKGSLDDTLDMLSPWVMLLNPCNPRRDNMKVASQYRKWQHVFPRAISSGSFKWSSLCSPAALPLTAEYKPSASELEAHYHKKVRRHILSNSSSLKDEAARTLVERLIDVRLIRGFQIVAIRNSGSDQTYQTPNKPTLMALGRRYHEVQRLSDFEVQIVQYEPKAGIGSQGQEAQHYLTSYEPKMRMATGASLMPEVTYHSESVIADWSPLDEHILGLAPLPDFNVTFRIRFVLIPGELSRNDRNIHSRLGGLSDDERYIEGIQRLTQTWQRQRHFSIEDQQNQLSLTKAKTPKAPSERDPNPLAIEYQTKDPSVFVNAYGYTLSTHLEDGDVEPPLFAESEKHHSSNFDMSKLVKQMQELPPYGVGMRDRRWLTLTHLKCFRGDEMTTWLLSAFKDLKLRNDAVELGNQLMTRGIFTHVRQKHNFRDGHYFYQISSAHRTTDYPDTQSLFSKAPWKSVPATPISENVKSPTFRPITGDSSSTDGKGTPVIGPVDKKPLLLSQVMQYNVDPQKNSNHLQVISLHYDRIHNPENCYHIQLEWLGTSTKLIKDSIARWSSAVDGYGLKLVQVPLQEAQKYREHHPFDQPQPIKLAAKPPSRGLATPVIDPYGSSPRSVEDSLAYHKAILRKEDFVLDYEAASDFTSDLYVTYSWGPPSYEHTQFVHKSGLVLAQIIGDEHNDFVLLPNRLAAAKPPSSGKQAETETVKSITKAFKDFCRDETALRQFYTVEAKPRQTPSPFNHASLVPDFDVPPFQLPPHLSHRALAFKNVT